MRKNLIKFSMLFLILIFTSLLFFSSCNNENNTLVPYDGSTQMSNITVEDSSFTPKITWVGGYVSVVGVNTGNLAALNSSLVWLIYMPDDQIHYPVKFGTTPSGAQNLTTQYNGSLIDSLIEDSTYTFWVMKASDWDQISSMQNKILVLDSTLTTSIQIDGDTIRLSPAGHTQKTQNLDNYVNFKDYFTKGQLADIFVEQPRTSNNPRISWQIKQSGVTDSLISAIGITEGTSYNNSKIIWEVYSVSDSAGSTYYGKKNVIAPPVIAGQEFPETFVFTAYSEGGLKRNTSYYVWIANKNWDGENRSLVTQYYAYAYFTTY
jgi:hypothetical protein